MLQLKVRPETILELSICFCSEEESIKLVSFFDFPYAKDAF